LDERLIKSVMLSPDKEPFELKIVNESENGMCCEYSSQHRFEIGAIIEVGADKKYQVRWTKLLSDGSGQLGLKVVQ
jgi:hypothetical protein